MDGYEERKKRTADSILAAAIELFSKQGISKTNVEEIALRAGVNPISVYNRFGNKRNLIRAAVMRIAESQWESAQAILEGEGDFLARLNRLMDFKRREAASHDPELFAAAIGADPELAAEFRETFVSKVNPAMEAFLDRGRAEGAIRSDISPEVLRAYLDMFFDMARKHPGLFEGRERAERTTREIWGLLLGGLGGNEA